MITLTQDEISKVELYVKKASGFLKRPDVLSIKTATAYLEKAVNLFKNKGFDVARKEIVPTYKKGQRSEEKQYFCQNANCPKGKILLDFKTMYVKDNMIFCDKNCFFMISSTQQ